MAETCSSFNFGDIWEMILLMIVRCYEGIFIALALRMAVSLGSPSQRCISHIMDVCKSLIKDTEIELSSLQMFKDLTSKNYEIHPHHPDSRVCARFFCCAYFFPSLPDNLGNNLFLCEASCAQIWIKPLSASSTLLDTIVNLRTNPQVIGFATGSE